MAEESKRTRFIAGLACATVGFIAGFFIYFHPERLHAPAWVAFGAATAFVAAGCALAAGAYEAKKIEGWLGVLTVAGLLVPAGWIALGPGPRACSVTLPFLGAEAADWICRGVFGIAALLALLLLVLMINRVARL